MPDCARVIELETVDSTNAEAMRRAAGGDAGPLWVRADRQEAGKGREGRAWVSEAGNLYCSHLFPADLGNPAIAGVSLVAALAVHDAIAAACERSGAQVSLCLKWPNDVLVEGAKISGVLLETASPGGVGVVVIGMGVNVAHHPNLDGYRTTCLSEHAPGEEVGRVFRSLRSALTLRLAEWNGGEGFERQREIWLSRACGFGEQVTVQVGGTRLKGVFCGLASSGAMILRDDQGASHMVLAGDVRFSSLAPRQRGGAGDA